MGESIETIQRRYTESAKRSLERRYNVPTPKRRMFVRVVVVALILWVAALIVLWATGIL